MGVVIQGPVHTWSIEKPRKYTVVTLPFIEAQKVFRVERYSSATHKGEQRDLVTQQVNALKRAMLSGSYTPTPIAVGLRNKHRERLTYTEDNQVILNLEDGEHLPQTDGQQRFGSLAAILQEAIAQENATLKEAVEQSPITAMIMLDGDTREDFINLQLGKPVDTSHMLSLRVSAKLMDQDSLKRMKLAIDTAKVLNINSESPFFNLIRFDSKKRAGALASIPLITLTSQNSSDLATSLFGLAKVGVDVFKPDELAMIVCEIFKVLKDQCPESLANNHPLTPPNAGGTKGSATMLIGLAVCMAHRLILTGQLFPKSGDSQCQALLEAVRVTMSDELDGNFAGPVKRQLMGDFAEIFFEDIETEKHERIPVQLLRTLSCSTFARTPLPRTKKSEPALAD